MRAPRGRASQLRAGASASASRWLLFLHADSEWTDAAGEALLRFLGGAGEEDFGHFRFALRGDRFFYRFIEVGQRLRERVVGLAYGDQGLVVSRPLYERVGGYPEWPILEDVGLLERLGAVGRRHALGAELPTSPRRYDAGGGIREWLRHAAIIFSYRAGSSPEALARRYPRTPPGPRTPERIVIVFAKAPRPGLVKTRLAADVGAEEAVRLYRALGRATVDALRGGAHALRCYHHPADPAATAEVRSWLGPGGVDFAAQRGADLGERMAHALDECLDEAEEVCIVGTDIPGLGAEAVADAFRLLATHDVVIGPATDGGYYLLALREPRPELFADVPWSTGDVLDVTLRRAAEAGLTVGLLAPKSDVDTYADVPEELLRA